MTALHVIEVIEMRLRINRIFGARCPLLAPFHLGDFRDQFGLQDADGRQGFFLGRHVSVERRLLFR